MEGRHVLLKVTISLILCFGYVTTLEYEVQYEVAEEQPPVLVGNVPNDADLLSKYGSAVLPLLTYSILSDSENPDLNPLFVIEQETGELLTNQLIDREVECDPDVECVKTIICGAVSPSNDLEIITIKIKILDVNDNIPQFGELAINLGISEAAVVGTKIRLPVATDADSGLYSVQHYELLGDTRKFELESTNLPNGVVWLHLVLRYPLDREDVSSYQLELVAYDGGSPPNEGHLDVEITVQDDNDNSPSFGNNTVYSVTVSEDSPVNTTIVTVHASDADEGEHALIHYSFGDGSEQVSEIFSIDMLTGRIFLKQMLNYESQSVFQILVMADDNGANSQPAFTTVIVNVEDINDNSPKITFNVLPPAVEPEVSEFDAIGTFIAHVSVSDPDGGLNGEFDCQLDSTAFQLEILNDNQYKVLTAQEFDRESRDTYEFRISCFDFGLEPLMSTRTIEVRILDENDNPPIFTQDIYTLYIPENNNIDTPLLTVTATDDDAGVNSELTYWLDGDMANLFRIDYQTGEINSKIIFDYETMWEFTFNVIVQDSGTPSYSATSTVLITVQDTNDEPPLFTQMIYPMAVSENQQIGMEIGNVSAHDLDSPPNDYFEYSLFPSSASQMFAVDTRTGRVRTKAVLDREIQSNYQLVVMATNVQSSPALSSTAVISVNVLDDNDNHPIIDFPSAQNSTLQVSSQTPRDDDLGFLQAHDVDEGINAELTFAIIHGNAHDVFRLHALSGILSTNKDLWDYADLTFELIIRVTDNGFPQLSSHDKSLNIVVNRTLGYYGLSQSGALIGTHNLTIVISLVVASVIVIFILIVAIILVVRKTYPKGSQYRYNANGIQVWNGTNSVDSEKQVGDQTKDASALLKDGNFNTSSDSSSPASENVQNQNSMSMANLKGDTSNLKPSNSRHNSHSSFRGENHYAKAPNYNSTVDPKQQKLWELSVKQLQPWYPAGADGDAESSSSGEVSNTDSGRGPSEEGENLNTSLPGHSHVRRLPPQVQHGSNQQPPRLAGPPSSNRNSFHEDNYAPAHHLGVLGNPNKSGSRNKLSPADPRGEAPDRKRKLNTPYTQLHLQTFGPQRSSPSGHHHPVRPSDSFKRSNLNPHMPISKDMPTNHDTHVKGRRDSDRLGKKHLMNSRPITRESPVPPIWEPTSQSSLYGGDGGSSTSGSYILDSKDLEGGENSSYAAVVV